MTEQAERYDRISEGYARWWAPVIAPAALAAIDEVAAAIDGATRVLDVGTGTGTLAVAMLERWSHIRVTAIDASSGMIDKAGGEADRLLTSGQRSRLDLRVAFADDLGLADGSIDVAVSSFVLQLVQNRFRALRDVHRVLRPGGQFGWVSWLERDGGPWAPDADFDDALVDVGEEPRDWSDRPGDLRDPTAAAAQMRRAGFADVRATAGELVHPYTVEGAVGFLAEFDEEDLVQSLSTGVREQFDAALRARLRRRRPDELALRLPTVTVRGTRR